MMTLNDFVQAYDGDVLFDAREIETVRDNDTERQIVSFDRNERNAIKTEILERPVTKYRAEVSSSANAVTGRTYSVTMVVILGEATLTTTTDPSGGATGTTE